MDVLPDAEERQVRAEARAFLADKVSSSLVRGAEKDPLGYNPDLWATMAGLGWIGISLPAEVGGQELPTSFAGLLLSEVGRHLAPVPLHSTMTVASVVAEHGTDLQRSDLLPDLCSGRRIATFALQDKAGTVLDLAERGVDARRVGSDLLLSGERWFVDNVSAADWLLVSCRDETGAPFVAVVERDAPGVDTAHLVTTAKDRQGVLRLEDVRIPDRAVLGSVAAGKRILTDLFDYAVAFLTAQIAGATRKDMEMAVEYAKQRHAFGRPIGGFQAIQHMCADMAIWVDGVDMLAAQAIWRLGAGLPASVETSMAKAFAAEKCIATCRSSQQIHGGIGFMMEFDLQLWYRRVAAWCLRLGSAPEHRRRVAAALLDGGATGSLRIGAPLVPAENR